MAGSCDIYPAPEYVVLGKTTYDQDRIDEYVAVGSDVCNKPRPKARPPEFDAPVSPPAAKRPAAKKRPGMVQRIKTRVRTFVQRAPTPQPRPAAIPGRVDPPQPQPEEVDEPVTPPAPAPAPAPAVPLKPCDPLSELLKDCRT